MRFTKHRLAVIEPFHGETMAVVNLADGQAVVASNPEHGEYALYRVERGEDS